MNRAQLPKQFIHCYQIGIETICYGFREYVNITTKSGLDLNIRRRASASGACRFVLRISSPHNKIVEIS